MVKDRDGISITAPHGVPGNTRQPCLGMNRLAPYIYLTGALPPPLSGIRTTDPYMSSNVALITRTHPLYRYRRRRLHPRSYSPHIPQNLGGRGEEEEYPDSGGRVDVV